MHCETKEGRRRKGKAESSLKGVSVNCYSVLSHPPPTRYSLLNFVSHQLSGIGKRFSHVELQFA